MHRGGLICSAVAAAALMLAAEAGAAQPSRRAAASVAAVPTGTLQARGEAGQTASFTLAEVAALPHETVKAPTGHGEGSKSYDGARLVDVLRAVGAPLGARLHGSPVTDLVVFTGADGYRAVMALADADPDNHPPARVILADSSGGQPLDGKEGPLRLVIEGDLRAARSVKNLVRVEVRRLPSERAPVRVAVAGALGRMGRALAGVLEEGEGLKLAARFDRPGAEGEGLVSRDEALALADVVIDFTTPSASVELARIAAERGAPRLVIGSTGLSPDEEAAIARAAERVAVVRSGNFSLGLNVLLGLVRQAARALPAGDWDVEVLEAHHRRKVDAPSGTALMLGRAAAAGRGAGEAALDLSARLGQVGPRPPGKVGFAVVRGGGIVGEHSVLFAAEEEVLTLAHSARDRGLFARGAVEAARWVATRPPGLYDMQDVLGFEAGPAAP